MNFLNHFITNYGLLAIFFIILLEYACFPISSEIVLPFSGALASYQNISFFPLLILSILAGLIGTCFCFFLGHYSGTYFIDKFLTRFPKKEKSFQSSYALFQKYGVFATCFGRLIPICRTYIAFIAGAYKQPFSSFLFSSLIGISFWNCILIGIGYYFRENWEMVKTYYNDYKICFLLFIFLILSIHFFKKYKKKYKKIQKK